MELDEHGREVRHRPPPGRRPPQVDEGAFPEFEHNQWTFEGEIERLGTFARGVRRSRRSSLVRGAGWIVLLALLFPIVYSVFVLVIHALRG